jgi:hypothetical protein
MQPDMYDIARFFSKVDVRPSTADCWTWKSAIASGYGRFSLADQSLAAHRFSYTLFHGPIPDGLHVRHRCDNPLCVNPWHLETGTNYDNVRDRVIRNRSSRGETNGRAKLTEEQVLEIFHDKHSTLLDLGRKYGIDPTAARNIKIGRSWSHVTGKKLR